MLAQRSFPTVLPYGADADADAGDLTAVGFGWLDVASRIGQAIFGNLGRVETFQDGPIQSTRFSIPSSDGSCTITGCHAYYSIPLGQTGTNAAWHAGLVMYQITTSKYREEEAARRRSVALTHPITQSGSEPQWLCTMAVEWEDSVSASVVAPKLIQQIKANKLGYALNTCSLDGMLQQLKIQCPPDITPTQAKGFVRQCVKDAPVTTGLVTPITTTPYLTPDIQLTMSTLLLPSARTNSVPRVMLLPI